MPDFLPGLDLARAFYDEVVGPLLRQRRHSAARLGAGSDVLGLDTKRSTDHGWGPRLEVFVDADSVDEVRSLIDEHLPKTVRGWPVRFGWDDVPVGHHVEVDTVAGWLARHLGFDPLAGISTIDWLVTPQQLLLEVTAGAVFHDGLAELGPARRALAWYPDDVWLWLIACQWRRIDQEEPFVGRTAEVGDHLGSRLVAARLCRDVIRLCFLLERSYAPYTKWLGSAFARLDAAGDVGPALGRVLDARDDPSRERELAGACEALARRFNALGLTEPVEPTVRPFFDRPYLVLGAGRFVEACLARVRDPWLRSLPLVGAIDQFADSTEVVEPGVARRFRRFFEPS
jgi:hypothetical protein